MQTRRTIVAMGALLASTAFARAADAPPDPAPPDMARPACGATLSFPAYGGPIKQDPRPACLAIPGVGDVYVGGAVTGYAYIQSTASPPSTATPLTDRTTLADISNLQVFLQKPQGLFQAYLQAGLYALPTLGFPTFRTVDETRLFFGPVPVVYGKIQPDGPLSIQGGQIFSLIGVEQGFTFQNLNITRGLLSAQENIVSRGVQVDYAQGPLTVSAAGTDGFFSGTIDWLSGRVAYALDGSSTVTFDAGANLGRSAVNTFATPLLQNNSAIYDLIYSYSHGPWTVTPYLQITEVGRDERLGIRRGAASAGGAVLASYAFTKTFALAGRVEAEGQTGRRGGAAAGLLFGPGSSAASITLTPTFTFDRLVLRGEYSHTQLADIARGDPAAGVAGSGFGRSGTGLGQDRFMVEGGITF